VEARLLLLQERDANLSGLLAWFREGCSADQSATLLFPAALSKEQRAQVHQLVKSIGLGVLASVSEGVGKSRCVSVLHSGSAKACRKQLTEKQQLKAYWLYKWANRAGMVVSRDEVSDMLLYNCLTVELERMWTKGSTQQKYIMALCEAILQNNMAEFLVIP
jgi:hypothetical protein